MEQGDQSIVQGIKENFVCLMCNMQLWIDLVYLSTAYAWDTYYYMLDCMLWESVWPRDFAGQKHVFKQKRKSKCVWPSDFKEIAF